MESQLYSGNEEDYNISEFSEEPLYPRYAVNTMSIIGKFFINLKSIRFDFFCLNYQTMQYWYNKQSKIYTLCFVVKSK